MHNKILLDANEIDIILNRLACQLVENHVDFSETVLIGLQPRGVFLADRIKEILIKKYNLNDLALGYLDTTFYRDDFRRRESPLKANQTDISFLVENKKVVFIDDVLYSGRTINAALSAIQSFGRPSEIELMVLIDRRFSRHLPIQPDYKGRQVDVINEEKVKVCWSDNHAEDVVYLIKTE